MSNKGRLVKKDKEKTEILNIFASAFTSWCSTHSPQAGGSEGGNWLSSAHSAVSRDQVCDHLRKLNIHKSMSSTEMHYSVLSSTEMHYSVNQGIG